MGWKAGIAAALCCVSWAAHAQTPAEPPAVDWRLEVVRDGSVVDVFDGSTALGQAQTATHHHETVHRVGCAENPVAKIDLARTLTISPQAADTAGVTFAIDAQEILEDDTPQRTREGCPLPPAPRRVSASHPNLVVPGGQWASWTVVDLHPTLIYRIRASVASH
ncbi:MAG TPA: hypothetical protein VL598_07465 [Trinickia sp.]|uniref:hypothetical protein n=1 Tax=Trinickia sp. TaxID=2571163 RepID=UPI002CC8F039|nr:hypothetical protein [Trinickia sp.]HTI17486.1 hypothetical protein [Trinickia sp.]